MNAKYRFVSKSGLSLFFVHFCDCQLGFRKPSSHSLNRKTLRLFFPKSSFYKPHTIDLLGLNLGFRVKQKSSKFQEWQILDKCSLLCLISYYLSVFKMKISQNEKPKSGFQAFSALEWDKIKASRGESVHGEELIALAKVRKTPY